MVFDLEVAERDTAGEALGEMDLDEERFDIVPYMADSIVKGHCQNEVVAEVGRQEQSFPVEEVVVLASEELASLEIQMVPDIVGLLHLPMHLMAFHEEIQAISVHRLEEEE